MADDRNNQNRDNKAPAAGGDTEDALDMRDYALSAALALPTTTPTKTAQNAEGATQQ